MSIPLIKYFPPRLCREIGGSKTFIPKSLVSFDRHRCGYSAGEIPAVDDDDEEFGFHRAEMRRAPLAGTVGAHDRHLFLRHGSPATWPSVVDAGGLPGLLSAALKARKDHLNKRTRLTICEGEDGADSSNGEVLIFPEMIRYRGLTYSDVDNFVERVLVNATELFPGAVEPLTGSHIFVCSHGTRDRRCGVCGPALVRKFRDEVNLRVLQDQVSVNPCSHIGGHKYSGNVIIFGPNLNGEVSGHWYGYVTPEDVPILLEQHIGKGEIIEHLWRGQMGLSVDEQKSAQKLRLRTNCRTENKIAKGTLQETSAAVSNVNGTSSPAVDCFQGSGNFSCCQSGLPEDKPKNDATDDRETDNIWQDKKSR